MRNRLFSLSSALGVSVLSAVAMSVAALASTTVILVDKKTSNLHVCEYVDGAYKILRTYHATLGQVKGDKEDEGDLKTPEGIYTFKHRMTAPQLQRKFGSLA